jgi:histone deacetylase 11
VTPLLVYSPDYDISLPGLGWLHPFDGKKFSRAWARLLAESAGECEKHWLRPDVPVAEAELLRVHSRDYLRSLSSAAVVAKALEIRAASFLPGGLIERRILTPMRMAVAGTLLATRHALRHDALVMNIGGGFHHAFRDRGEGFCIYADVAAAIATVRAEGLLTDSDPIAIIDLDAHRGNGVWDLCGADPAVRVFDVYNFQVYPGLFPGSIDDFPFQIPVKARTTDDAYLGIVREELPVFLDSMARPRLAIYNAGTDILAGDPVGHLAVSAEGVVARDDAVLRALLERKIPTVIVTSGGYAAQSHELIAKLALRVLRNDRMGTLR